MKLGDIYIDANNCVREILRLANEARLGTLEEGPSRESYADLAHLLTTGALAIQRDLGRFAIHNTVRKGS